MPDVRRVLLGGLILFLTPVVGAAPRIGLSLFTLENPHFAQLAAAAAEEGRRLGYEVCALDAGLDAAVQDGHVRRFADEGFTAVVLAPVDAISIGAAIRRMNAAGVPVFTVDTACSDRNASVVSHVATDNYGGGKQIAHAVIEALGGRGGSVVLVSNPLLEACTERTRGFRVALAAHNARQKNASVEIVGVEKGGTVFDDGVSAARRILAARERPAAIFAMNDPSALGVRSVLCDEPSGSRPLVFGFDASEKGKAAVREGRLVATAEQHPDEIGREVIRAVVRHLRHEPVPAEILIPASLYR